jgi:hypothetical protein
MILQNWHATCSLNKHATDDRRTKLAAFQAVLEDEEAAVREDEEALLEVRMSHNLKDPAG